VTHAAISCDSSLASYRSTPRSSASQAVSMSRSIEPARLPTARTLAAEVHPGATCA